MMIVETIASALISIATEGIISKAKERVNLFAKKNGINLPPPNNFDGVYVHALIEFSEGKPPVAVELFKHDFIQNSFRLAYEQNNTNILIAEIENLIDWHIVGDGFQGLDINPQIFVKEFAKIFHSIVDRTRTPYEIREEIRSKTILENQIQ